MSHNADYVRLRKAGARLANLIAIEVEGHTCEVAAKSQGRTLESWCSYCAALVAWDEACEAHDG